MSDLDKTKEELLAEIASLRAKMGPTEDESAQGAADDQASKGGITRRDVITNAWVAPVILTVPIAVGVSQRAFAQPPTSAPTSAPTFAAPTMAPTVPPTAAPTSTPPTAAPTSPPTAAPPMTSAPTSFPTAAPTAGPPVTVAPPTAAPTAFPTAAPEPIPVEISGFDIS